MPLTASAAASAASSLLKIPLGAAQTAIGFFGGKKAKKELENLSTPAYAPNQGIANYYKTALNRSQTNPYASQGYTVAQQNAGRTLSAGLGALNDRRGGIAGISRLSAINNDAMLKAGVNAENQQNQRFGQLGGATQMKAADDKYGFQIKQLMPYQKKLGLLTSKVQGMNDMLNSGISNLYGGITGGAQAAAGLGGGSKGGSSGGGGLGGNSYGSGGPQIL
jgi:hypothetical protein